MKTLKKSFIIAILFLIGGFFFSTPCFAQSYGSEQVVGYVSGSLDAGEAYELYRSSADSFREYLAGWKDMGWRDNMKNYSYDEVYNKCLDDAKRQYGRYYPNLYLKNFDYDIKEIELDDMEYYSQVSGSSTQFRKKQRVKKEYRYSATVVVSEISVEQDQED